ncbi:hypothetical protein BU15DRAFT_71682 [Melanogaster broomeanus]|nr:hypothetical protein BU15DRAFT_71682 [Melanogaster broomeanus]
MASALGARVSKDTAPNTAHLVVNVLSAAQSHLAERFARPDLHPRPFQDPDVQWNALGRWASRPLGGIGRTLVQPQEIAEVQHVEGGRGLASELFIARVLRVEQVPPGDDGNDDRLGTLPLLYHRRQYATACDLAKS